MKKKLLWMSFWAFMLGFLLMWMNLHLLYFFGIVGFFLFTLWTGPKADGHYSEEEYAHDKRQSIMTMILAAAYISAGFLVLIIQTFFLA